MISAHDIASIVGRHVVDSDGHKVGAIGQVYVDPSSGQPNWVTVKTGLFGKAETFVPLEQAEEVEGELRVPFTKDAVKDAPRFDSHGELTHSQENELYAYYALHDPKANGGTAGANEHDNDSHDERRDEQRDDRHNDRDADADTDAGTTHPVQTGTMRLRKYVVTEQTAVTVPVTREEVRVEWEADADTAPRSDPDRPPTDR